MLVVGDRIVALGSKDEISWDELGPLMKQLEERMLSVRGRLAKQDGACRDIDELAAPGNRLAV